jgi:eukaryotic-like serine/threonine-protein kinase
MRTAAPQTLGPYEILEPLGVGGMGVVYRARHSQSGELAAVKTVRLPQEGLLSGIRREIHALARIRHPGIVRIVAEGMEEGLPWYAMELLEGTTLRRHAWIVTGALLPSGSSRPDTPPMPPGSTLEIGFTGADRATAQLPGADTAQAFGPEPHLSPEQLATVGVDTGYEPTGSARVSLLPAVPPSGPPSHPAAGGQLTLLLGLVRRLCAPLAFLHGEGIVHRDLKPDNVFVLPDGAPVLMDFGLSSLFGGRISREVLQAESSIIGTVAYMAPEQIRGELLDARADLYALGCILYELVTGQPPFALPSARETLEAHLLREPTPPSALVLDVPAELDELVLRLLAKRPRERIGYADDVAKALGRLGAAEPADPSAPRARSYLYRPRLAGRADVLAEVERHLERLGLGQGGVIFLGGESGVGKTRIAMEAHRRAKRRSIRMLAGECLPASAPNEGSAGDAAPLHALRRPLQRLADWCREWGAARTERILGRRGKLLALYEPALGRLAGLEAHPDPVELPAEAARFRLFSALSTTLAALAEDRPLLLVLDDLHWADDLTLGLLEFLQRAGRLERMRLLVLATYRTEEVGPALARAIASPEAPRVMLDRLGEKAVGAMVCDMLALREPPASFVSYLTRHSEGNPFFVAEYLQTAVAEGVLFRDEEGDWQVAEPSDTAATEADYRALPLPGSLRELLGRRLHSLPESARRLVEAAAVAGRESSVLVAWAVSKLDDAELLDALTELIARHVLAASGPGLLRFLHEKLREVAYGDIPPRRRAGLHRDTAETIEALLQAERDVYLAELGHHWQQAGIVHRARDCYLAAARRAAASFAFGQAASLYRSYLALVERPEAASVEARLALASDVLFLQGRTQEAVD